MLRIQCFETWQPGINFTNILRAAFRMKVFCAALMCLQFRFVIFWRKDFGAQSAHKMFCNQANVWKSPTTSCRRPTSSTSPPSPTSPSAATERPRSSPFQRIAPLRRIWTDCPTGFRPEISPASWSWCQCYKTFFPSLLMTRPNKLVGLPLETLSSRVIGFEGPEPTQLEDLSDASWVSS